MTCAHGAASLDLEFTRFIEQAAFPCIGAKAALAQSGLTIYVARDIQSWRDDQAIHDALVAHARATYESEDRLTSFTVIFECQTILDERAFEQALWQRLGGLVAIDKERGVAWSPQASNDVNAATYAMSVDGKAYFIIGLHPNASRTARQFGCCAMVFNAHSQFEAMRGDGRYQRFQSINRARELAADGSINPMLRDFGTISEASQYSGRHVDAAWTCPLMKEPTHA